MRLLTSYATIGALVLLALDVLAPPVGLGLSVHAWSVVPPGNTLQTVDRSHKGDRLDISVTTVEKRRVRTSPPKMMIGCDPVFSPLSAGARANYPGRCDV